MAIIVSIHFLSCGRTEVSDRDIQHVCSRSKQYFTNSYPVYISINSNFFDANLPVVAE